PGHRSFSHNARSANTAASVQSMAAPASSQRTWSSNRRATVATPALPAQQTRELAVMLTPPRNNASMEEVYDNFIDVHLQWFPDLKDAKFLGCHYSTAANVEKMLTEGFNVDLSGKNWEFEGRPYSQDGPGLYLTDNASLGINYALKAMYTQLEQTDGEPDYRMQPVAIYEKPGPVPKFDDDDALIFTHKEHGTVEIAIPPLVLNGTRRVFLIAPLPEFHPHEIDMLLPKLEKVTRTKGPEDTSHPHGLNAHVITLS
ncbi:MAG: hypothetical protein ACRYGK_03170, partial [Janthinobacterium lividum]